MKCTKCGAELDQNANFCYKCGNPVNSNQDSSNDSFESQDLKEEKNLGQERLEEVKKEVEEDQEKIEKNIDQTVENVKEKIKIDEEEIISSAKRETEQFKESAKEKAQEVKKDFQNFLGNDEVSGNRENFNSNNNEVDSVEVKPSDLIKFFSIGATVLMVIFAIVYLIDLLGIIFNTIGGIF